MSLAAEIIKPSAPIGVVDVVAPIVVALIFIAATSAFKEPQRRNFMAIMIAGAGAAYLNGEFGVWEFAFKAVVTFFAYKGLASYSFIGVGCLNSGCRPSELQIQMVARQRNCRAFENSRRNGKTFGLLGCTLIVPPSHCLPAHWLQSHDK